MIKKYFKPLLCIAYIAGLIVLLEVAFGAYYYFKNGRFISPETMIAPNEFLVNDDGESECSWVGVQTMHPFLGYYSIMPETCLEATNMDINWQGFFGRPIPLENDPETFDILLTGGSVAARLGQMFKNGPRFLEETLNQQYIPPTGSSFRVYNGANGGWSQPQQVIMALLYGGGVDAVVSLEGYNEHWPFTRQTRIDAPNAVFQGLVEQSFQSKVVVYSDIMNEMTIFMHSNWVTRKSYFLYSFYDIARSVTKKKLANVGQRIKLMRESFNFTDDMGAKEKGHWNTDRYHNYLLTFKDTTDQQGLLHAVLIQPVPRIGKQLTSDEKESLGNNQYAKAYRSIVENLFALRKHGVNIRTLLHIYQDETETIYEDDIHPYIDVETGYGRGYVIMADEMAIKLAEMWGLKARQAVQGNTPGNPPDN